MIIKKRCSVCNDVVEVIREIDLPGMKVAQLFCGHYQTRKILAPKDLDIVSSDGKHPYKFQLEGAAFMIQSGMRVLCADEMGLGKTVQFLMAVHSDPEAYCPFLLIGKAKLKLQYMKEAIRWAGLDYMPQVVEGEKEFVLPLKGYIMSYDILRRFDDLPGWVATNKIKTIGLDEVQAIKNHTSKRTNAVRKAAENVPYVVALSGTPIKNNTVEYFPILNILRPDKFPSLALFQKQDIDTYFDGYKTRTGGLREQSSFANRTKDFIIRRTREQVLPDLPKMTRNALFAELGPDVEKAYAETFKQYKDAYNTDSATSGVSNFQRQSNLMAYLSKMRHLAGIAKIAPAVDYVRDFLNDTDRKIILFAHHKDVAGALKAQIETDDELKSVRGREVLEFASDTKNMQEVQDKFWESGPNAPRVVIASTLAAGEGLNLQCCSDAVLVERQWNPANEEQAEGRILRIGQTAKHLTTTYLVAVGTVDEFFAEIVERKRALVANALDGAEIKWDEASLMQELMEVLAAKGGKKWGW